MIPYRIDKTVGLSTEDEPSSLSRTEFPDLRNVEVDLGGICRTRDGYERLSSTPLKDASWRLRGAPYNPTIFREYYDALIIPHHARYESDSGGGDIFVRCIVEITANAIGSGLSIHDVPIICKGNSSTRTFYLYLDGTSLDWKLEIIDSDIPTTRTLTVVDSGISLTAAHIGQRRLLEVGDIDDAGSTVQLRVIDCADGSEVGSTSDTLVAWTSGSDPWLIGAISDANGDPAIPPPSGTQYGQFKISDVAFEFDYATVPTLAHSNPDNADSDTFHSREFTPTEYSAGSVAGYFRMNDGDRRIVRDSCDTVDNDDYAGGLVGNHGVTFNSAPQWLEELNSLPFSATTNPDVSSGTGIGIVNRYGLLFNGYDGVAIARTGSLDTNTLATDPLNTAFIQSPAAGVGWTAELVITILMREGATAYPDRHLYVSADNATATNGINPISFTTSSDQFVCSFADGVSTKTITLTTFAVSDFAGEKVTLVASRDNNTLTFMAIGENKFQSLTTTLSGVPTISGGTSTANSGPFVMLMRLVATWSNTLTDEPSTYSGPAAYGVLHEFRLWSEPHNVPTSRKLANRDVPVAGRSKLPVYLKFNAGYGNQATSLGTIVKLPPFTTGSPPIMQTNTMDTKIVPPQESGPEPATGMVTPFRPVKVLGAIDFRNAIGERVSRSLFFVAGASAYTFDLATNTLTEIEGGPIFKTYPEQYSMVQFGGRVYFANGNRPNVFDGDHVRLAGIAAPIQRPYTTSSTSGGSIDEGDYFIGYRFANSRSGFVSNISPLRKVSFSGGSNANRILTIQGIEVPRDPQVDTIEIFATLEGDASTLYWVDTLNDVTAGSYTTVIGSLQTSDVDTNRFITLPNLTASPPTLGDIFAFGEPRPSKAIGLLRSTMFYAATQEPGIVYFSRFFNGPEVEHVNVTPGASHSLAVETDAGDEIQTLEPLQDALVAYFRDARAEISFNIERVNDGIGVLIPFQIEFLDLDRGVVATNAVVNLLNAHAFMSETDIFVRSRRDDRNISSASVPDNLPKPPKIGRTLRDQLAKELLRNAVALHRQGRQQLWFMATTEGSPCNDIVLIYSFRLPNRWTKYVIPWIDYALEVESTGDRRVPIGFINSYVCKLDDTGREVDSYDGVLTGVVSKQIDSTTATTISVSTALTENMKFRHAWVENGQEAWPVVILYVNRAKDIVTYDSLGVDLTAVSPAPTTIRFGAIYPAIEFCVNPAKTLDWKTFRLLDVAMGEGGSDALKVWAWYDKFDYDVTGADAQIAGQDLAVASRTLQFARAGVGGSGRFARFRLASPTGVMSISSLRAQFDLKRGVKTYG